MRLSGGRMLLDMDVSGFEWTYWICYQVCVRICFFFFFSSRRRHTRCSRDWSSDVCSSDLDARALQSHARADRIDAVVARPHRDLGAAARFPCRGADLDDLLLNFGDLQLEDRKSVV